MNVHKKFEKFIQICGHKKIANLGGWPCAVILTSSIPMISVFSSTLFPVVIVYMHGTVHTQFRVNDLRRLPCMWKEISPQALSRVTI
jgi:hypothetical protein